MDVLLIAFWLLSGAILVVNLYFHLADHKATPRRLYALIPPTLSPLLVEPPDEFAHTRSAHMGGLSDDFAGERLAAGAD